MFSNSDELVTIATLKNQAEYIVVRGLLESAGIECISPDDEELRSRGRAPLKSKGIRVQVLASQAEEARAFLAATIAKTGDHVLPAEDDSD